MGVHPFLGDYEGSANLRNKILSDDSNEVTERVENLTLLVMLCNSVPYNLPPDQQTPYRCSVPYGLSKSCLDEGLFSIITRASLV